MSSRIFIIDTNVVVAGLITTDTDSPTAKALDAMLNGTIPFILSPALLREYRDVLLRPRICRLHGLNEQEIDQLLTEIKANAIWRETRQDKDHTPPDPQDAHLWSLLASEPNAILITGDRLLIENPRPQRSVISPATWAENLQKSKAVRGIGGRSGARGGLPGRGTA